MPRLPPRPALTWTDTGAPRSQDIGDVYFSGDGLSEKRAVFLEGCGLPGGWAGRTSYTVGELGFGAGVNFLALWDLWRRTRPSAEARLSVLSFEGLLMRPEDAARVHAAWPELADLSARMVSLWPDNARGVQRIDVGDGVWLTLHVGEAASALPEARANVDAWFLDGFSPAMNPDMWSGEAMAQIARISAAGAVAATYSVAGVVRRNLEATGFDVAKAPGHGRKKQRLEARLVRGGASAQPPPPRRVVVVGAGVAGACAARALLDRGCAVTVIDAGEAPGARASGNPLALVMPRLDASDGPVARSFVAAWLMARRFWPAVGADAVARLDARHLPRGEKESERFAKLLADPPLEASLLSPLDEMNAGAGVLHHGAVAVRPDLALPRLLNGAELRWCETARAIEAGGDGVRVRLSSGDDLKADVVIVCAGMGALPDGVSAPPLEGRLGQVESALSSGKASAVADGGYCVEALGRIVFGATFEAAREGAPPVSDLARTQNKDVLRRLRPDLDAEALASRLASRASVRATTQDRLPFAGPQPDAVASARVHLIGGLGARGYLWAPLLAELVVSDLFGEPAPLEASAIAHLSPGRFAARAARRAGR